MRTAELKHLAPLMAVNCVRNTIIEDYHALGKLSDPEMKAFNQQVANKLFTFLTYLFDKLAEDQQAFLNVMSFMYPTNWDQPKLDRSFTKAVKKFKKMGNHFA